MKKITTLLISFLVALSLVSFTPASAAEETISDEMQTMVDLGVISGYGDGTYRPYGKVTRAEFATFVSRALDLPQGEHKFTDVNRNSALAAGINAAAKAGIVSGVSAAKFEPNSLITREQMALMINNALGYLNVETKTTSVKVLDMNQVSSSVTKKAINSMIGHNIIKGYEAQGGILFKPKDYATREHAAAFINRMLSTKGTAVHAISDFERQVLELTNAERKKNGLEPFKLDTELSKVARLKSKDMNDKKYFSHTSPTYGSPFQMMQKFGITYRTAGENIAQGYGTPAAVVKGWMNSPGHRANILNANFTHIGIGHYGSSNYWTQMFIGKW
ncbi:MAG: S-layer homology domain-containing protein [Bacillus sp. (in: firmicutes)]